MKGKEAEAFLEMPYAKRKLIVVADDSVVEAERAARASTDAESNTVDWTAVVKESLEMYWRYMTIPGWIGMIKAARDQGVNVLSVSRSESTMLQFPPGHPQDGVLYVGHPTVHEIYYPTAPSRNDKGSHQGDVLSVSRSGTMLQFPPGHRTLRRAPYGPRNLLQLLSSIDWLSNTNSLKLLNCLWPWVPSRSMWNTRLDGEKNSQLTSTSQQERLESKLAPLRARIPRNSDTYSSKFP